MKKKKIIVYSLCKNPIKFKLFFYFTHTNQIIVYV